MKSKADVIAPGAVIGILGDGQLGKMTAMAAARLGYRVAVLGPNGRDSPAGHVSYWAEAWGVDASVSQELLDEFCTLVSVVLIEWENVPVDLVQRIEAKGICVAPNSDVLAVCQDRLLEKQCAQALDIPVVTHFEVNGSDGDEAETWPSEMILKTRRDGYDGKGQWHVSLGMTRAEVLALTDKPCILEEKVDFIGEVSVIVARSMHGSVFYGPFENKHEGGILRETTYPIVNQRMCAKLHSITNQALDATGKIAQQLGVHGLLAVEFFVAKDGKVIFNEMAPRPHNSGHLTIECCATSQFEQYVRACCNLPFGSEYFRMRGFMKNILGADVKKWRKAYSGDGVHLHVYGKDEPKDGRKMGHVTWTSQPR